MLSSEETSKLYAAQSAQFMRNKICQAALAAGNSKLCSKLRHYIVKFLLVHSSPWALAGKHHGNCHRYNKWEHIHISNFPPLNISQIGLGQGLVAQDCRNISLGFNLQDTTHHQPHCSLWGSLPGWLWLQKQQKGRTVSKWQKTVTNFGRQIIRWE